MAVTNISVFRSTDGGAVSGVNGRCAGTTGDGVALLNQLLLNGYNWQAVTNANLTNSGTTGSLTLTGHGFNIDQRLWLVGMDQAGYKNGSTHGDATYLLTVADANTLTFTTSGSPTSPATTGGGAGGTTTTLNGALTDTTGTAVVATDGVTHYPGATSFVIRIDTEDMLVTAGMGTNNWTVVRGFGGSTAATHSNSATITQRILIGVAPAGGFAHWTAPYTASNKSVYRPPAGNRFFMDVDDNTSAQNMEMRFYETMSAVATGTGQFPTTSQVAVSATVGYNCLKSTTADTTARSWVAIASDRMLILFVCPAQAANITPTSGSCIVFTDLIDQTKSGDVYATLGICGTGTSAAGGEIILGICNLNAVSPGHYFPRSYTQLGTSINVGKHPIDGRHGIGNGVVMGSVGLTYPHPPDGGLYVSKINVDESTIAISRGTIPGLWAILHAKPAIHLDTWTGTGTFAGKKFMAINAYSGGQLAFEISNTIQAT